MKYLNKMKVLYYIYILLILSNLYLCKKEDKENKNKDNKEKEEDSGEEGNIMLPMEGTNIEIVFQGKKIGNKNYYTVPLKVGTPEKLFNVQLDTSVATSWLPSVKCKNCNLSKNLYNESESTTSSESSDKEIELDDEDGDVEGYSINDAVTLNGYKLKNFSFVQVTELDDDFRDHYEGKLGLGYRGEHGKNFNFLDRLKANKLIAKRIFSINQINDKKGLLYIGDTSARKYTYCNVSSGEDLDEIYKESWVCDLTHVGIFDEKEGISNKLHDYTIISDGKVDFDSAYEYIAVPISYRQAIDELLTKANLDCETNEKEIKKMKKKLKEEEKRRKEEEENEEEDDDEDKEEKNGKKEEKNKKKEKNDKKNKNKNKLIYKYNDEEISIICKANEYDLSQKGLSLSFVLQGNVYSIALNTSFSVAGLSPRAST
jgi:hypothetical protein